MGGFVRKIFAPAPPAYTAPAYTAPAPAPAPAPAAPVAKAPEVEAPPTAEETLLKKKKKGRYSTLLTGGKGALGSPDIEKKSLLGS